MSSVRAAPGEQGDTSLGWISAIAIGWVAQAALPALLVITSTIRPGAGLVDHPGYLVDVG